MFALVIQNDPPSLALLSEALANRGYRVVTAGAVDTAQALARHIVFDVVIQAEKLDNRFTHPALLSVARKSPGVSAIILTDRHGEEADELFETLPNLYGLLPAQAGTDLIMTFVDASQSSGSVNVGRQDRPLLLSSPKPPESLETSLSALEDIFAIPHPDATAVFPDPVH